MNPVAIIHFFGFSNPGGWAISGVALTYYVVQQSKKSKSKNSG